MKNISWFSLCLTVFISVLLSSAVSLQVSKEYLSKDKQFRVVDIKQLSEKLMKNFSGPEFAQEIKLAKNEFFENAGILDETSDDFEVRMALFVDWFLLDRNLKSQEKTPVELSLEGSVFEMQEEEKVQFLALSQLKMLGVFLLTLYQVCFLSIYILEFSLPNLKQAYCVHYHS